MHCIGWTWKGATLTRIQRRTHAIGCYAATQRQQLRYVTDKHQHKWWTHWVMEVWDHCPENTKGEKKNTQQAVYQVWKCRETNWPVKSTIASVWDAFLLDAEELDSSLVGGLSALRLAADEPLILDVLCFWLLNEKWRRQDKTGQSFMRKRKDSSCKLAKCGLTMIRNNTQYKTSSQTRWRRWVLIQWREEKDDEEDIEYH